jgi:hypothetical protein
VCGAQITNDFPYEAEQATVHAGYFTVYNALELNMWLTNYYENCIKEEMWGIKVLIYVKAGKRIKALYRSINKQNDKVHSKLAIKKAFYD